MKKIKKISVEWKVLGKETDKSWFWGRSYKVIMIQLDTGKTTTRELTREQYYELEKGDILTVNMYTKNGHTFFFKESDCKHYSTIFTTNTRHR